MNIPWRKQSEDLDREVAYHIESLADAFEKQGMPRDQALARARKEFCGIDRVKEQCREQSRWYWLGQTTADVRFGWRMIRKSPVISLAAIVSLALGIGATTAIFSLAHSVLWRKIAVPQPEQLLEVYWEVQHAPEGLIRGRSGSTFPDGPLSVSDFFSKAGFESMQRRAEQRVEVGAHLSPQQVSIAFGGNAAVARIRGVSPNLFGLLRVKPTLGRPPGAEPEVLVTHGFWQRYLGAEPSVIGKILRVNNYPYTISGVLPPSFFGLTPGDETELYTTIANSPSVLLPDAWYRTR